MCLVASCSSLSLSYAFPVQAIDLITLLLCQVIDPIVPRFTALLKEGAVPVHISGTKEESKAVQKHPKVWYQSFPIRFMLFKEWYSQAVVTV